MILRHSRECNLYLLLRVHSCFPRLLETRLCACSRVSSVQSRISLRMFHKWCRSSLSLKRPATALAQGRQEQLLAPQALLGTN